MKFVIMSSNFSFKRTIFKLKFRSFLKHFFFIKENFFIFRYCFCKKKKFLRFKKKIKIYLSLANLLINKILLKLHQK